ncbi:MAG: type IV pilus assembly protein PilM [Fimbriimonadaceae bacterium]|nr:type IV pilus assembly protein PilM [Chthonomonadaceae bacterium]MCO5296470.1 type IV pilus assembly protein PilM [Fimbriimonadaceae bacterium]
MAKKLNSVLGIDIGSRKIKVAEVRSQGREPVVTALGMIDTPEGSVDHTGVYNSDAVGAALKQVLAESGASVPHAVISIAGQASVLVRTLEVPRMNPAELKEHMQWEINRNIPFAESTVVSDFQPLASDDPNSQNMDVVMAISPQSAIDMILACVKKAGKQTAAIDVEPLGLARSVKMSYDDQYDQQTVCVVDVGHKTTSINIFKGGKLLMPRQVPIGGEMFTKAVADAMGVGTEEAERLKSEKCQIPNDAAQQTGTFGGAATQEFQPYNPFTDEPAPAPVAAPVAGEGEEAAPASPAPVPAGGGDTQIYNAIAPVLDEFVAEIRRSIDYFRSRGGEVSRVTLCGGGSKLKGLAEFLASTVGIPCDTYDPLRRLSVSARKASDEFVNEHRQEFAVAVGNGLHIFFD